MTQIVYDYEKRWCFGIDEGGMKRSVFVVATSGRLACNQVMSNVGDDYRKLSF